MPPEAEPTAGPTTPWRHRGARILDLLLLAGLAWLLLRPGSAPRKFLEEHRAGRERARTAREAWPEAVQGPSLGRSEATGSMVVMFTDYRCPFCRMAQEAVDSVLKVDEGARVVIRHLPLRDLHPDAPRLARISICAEDDPAWPKLHRALPDLPFPQDEAQVVEHLAATGIAEPDAVLRCARSERAHRELEKDLELARRLGLRATPSFVASSTIHRGALSPSALREMLDPP